MRQDVEEKRVQEALSYFISMHFPFDRAQLGRSKWAIFDRALEADPKRWCFTAECQNLMDQKLVNALVQTSGEELVVCTTWCVFWLTGLGTG